jgi:syncollin
MKSLLFNATLAAGITIAPLAYAGCSLFEHRDYQGAEWYLEDLERMIMVDGESLGCTTNGHGGGCESVYYESSWNDVVSSFRVDSGCIITLWEHVNEDGARFRSDTSYRYVGGDWNDVASEAVCSCS